MRKNLTIPRSRHCLRQPTAGGVWVYLAVEQRRRGLGTDLVRRSIAYAPHIGVTTLLGFIFAHNEPSLQLFEKLGFQRWGFLPRVAVLDCVERDLIIVGLRV